ncbi:hypothetical protein [Actinoplanes aureus]|uniref:Uncharacterized protein n=1 Tax=Actinoplanes aureus TaxID=2792083 RepID=A0A931G813_9ACTN|nr:hypothetical protein [Actinoplanes aureus]MBG0568799.1 hypothetical protein [Actinoplanes aureus]
MVHAADSALSLRVSSDRGPGFRIIFHGERRRCTRGDCRAVTDSGYLCAADARWQPETPGDVIGDHEHQPSFPYDTPQPGTWSTSP